VGKPPNCQSNLTEVHRVRELIAGEVANLEGAGVDVAQHEVASVSGAMPLHRTTH
jgi:hypothetical protein